MIQITRRPRSEVPTEPGVYLVSELGVAPYTLPWRKGQTRWQYERSVATPPIAGWDGPVRGVRDELA